MKSKRTLFSKWLWTMAWRDSRKNRSRLLLFTSSIVLGIAALVAINSFRENLEEDIENQSKNVLGADLVLLNNKPLSDSAILLVDSIAVAKAHERSFASMIYFPKSGDTRLVQVRALDGDFPFYGEIKTEPPNAGQFFKEGKMALVDHTVLLQFNVRQGDSVKVGNVTFHLAGRIKQAPGQSGIAATAAPLVYIPLNYLSQTGLQQKGSRIQYRYYLKIDPQTDIKALVGKIENRLKKEGVRIETVQSTQQNLGNTFDNLAKFLNLVAFIALLLGSVGVASAVHIYIKEKLATVAILRCLGLKGWEAFMIYLKQILTMGLIGSIIGAFFGTIIQTALPFVLKDLLPIDISLSISWKSIFQGIGIGVFISVLFALIPLLNIRKISPLLTLRASFETSEKRKDTWNIAIYFLIPLFIYSFSFWLIGDWIESLFFCLVLGVSFLILIGVARLIMWLVRKYFPVSWSFTWRQGLANLYRPNNQTIILIIAIGLGTALISTLYFTQNLLLNKVSLSSEGEQPNMVMFDIQTSQKDEVKKLTESFDFPIIQEAPIVTMRLLEINGKTKETVENDSLDKTPAWAYSREYRVTYRNYLIDSETNVEKDWPIETDSGDNSIYISINEDYAERMKVALGDTLTFNIQGSVMNTIIGHLRKIEWNRIQTNFLVLFPEGVLEEAPQFHVIMTRAKDSRTSSQLQRALVTNFPNVSVIDLGLILTTIDQILEKISFVIKFMALFSILTGFFVLISSVILSKFQRIQESVLLRTIGASKKQITYIAILEYFMLGSLASATGIVLSLTSSWLLAYFSFETAFVPDLIPIFVIYFVVTTLTIFIGILNSREVLNKPPLEVLRKEV